MKKILLSLLILPLLFSCVSTKSTIKNIDDTALKPVIKDNSFVITEYSNDKKYGFEKDYPINIGFNLENMAPQNISYFFNALKGINGESFTYEKLESCCPFPTKRTNMGAGTLDVYQITFATSQKKVILYFNIYEKGKIMCPSGFEIKKQSN